MKTKIFLLALVLISRVQGYTQTINGGNSHSIILCEDSIVWTTGLNSIGQLGDGTTINKLTPIKVNGITDVVDVQAGETHSMVLLSDGSVWTWGNNDDGQLGNNSTDSSLIPIQVPGLSNIVKIATRSGHNIAIENSSTAWIWGDNQLNQINGTSTDELFPVSVGFNFIDIIVGANYTAELKQDSMVYVTASGLTLLGLTGISSIGAGYKHLFAFKNDGTIWAWGDNQYGQLGDGTTVSQSTSTTVQVTGLSNIISITGGQRHSIALKSDGTVWTWGWNGLGQLGDSTLIDQLTPIQVPGLSNVIEISAGAHHCMARRSDSSIWVWGNNISGQLGNDTVTNSMIPVQMMLSCEYQCPVPQIYSGGDLTICIEDSIMVFGTYQQMANTYHDSLLTSNGCDSIIEITLTVNTPPVVSFTGLDTTYCNVNTIVSLTGIPSGGSFSGSGTGGSVFNPSVAGIGTHTITYTYNDGICTVIASQDVTVTNCTGIDDFALNGFKIYPNPSTGIINIETREPIEIRNTLGQIIYKGIGGQIDLSEYGEGIYFVRVGVVIKKLILTQ